ncbi:copper chaperone PCu(A)C [Dactylosporangium sp. CA-092794]|uniref:copper chaperone PCu(A)C n=1 Tax=Dactylosporangium sp. CA-092794 TaxID=3239929 RepID=UPI003D8D26D5
MSRPLYRSLPALTVCAILLAGCTSGDPVTAPPAPTATGTSAQPALTIRDPWVKTAASGMSAAYGTLVNTSGRDIVVVAATSSASPHMELHETTTVDGKMAMRPKAGGFTIPAGGSHEFKPGGDHFMLMDVTTPVRPGDEVTFTLTLADGGTMRFTAVAKDFAGGNESYQPDGSASPMRMG